MTLALGLHVCTGQNIFVLSEIDSDEDITFDVKYRDSEYTLIIRPETKSLFVMQDDFKSGSG